TFSFCSIRLILYFSMLFYPELFRPLISTLFPYTTLFRSLQIEECQRNEGGLAVRRGQTDSHGRSCVQKIAGSTSSPRSWLFCFADRKSTLLNSSHLGISYAVFCLKKKNN